jgi:prophage antirepressor-like protein
MSEIQMFDNGEFELRVTQVGESFTVSGPSLARALGFPDASRMVRNLPTDEKGRTLESTPGGPQETYFVTEPGFYHIVGQRQPGRIKDPAARAQVERFQRWVHHEVLPGIRRTGGYHVVQHQSVGPYGVVPPDVFTYDEVCANLRQYYGIDLTVNELTRYLRAAGLLTQKVGPTARYKHVFWFTGTAYNVISHMMPQVAYRVAEVGRQLQDFRFLQTQLELDGVGRQPRIEERA